MEESVVHILLLEVGSSDSVLSTAVSTLMLTSSGYNLVISLLVLPVEVRMFAARISPLPPSSMKLVSSCNLHGVYHHVLAQCHLS